MLWPDSAAGLGPARTRVGRLVRVALNVGRRRGAATAAVSMHWMSRARLVGHNYHPPWIMEAWLEGLQRLRLALAGPAGDHKKALLRRRLGCYVADCA